MREAAVCAAWASVSLAVFVVYYAATSNFTGAHEVTKWAWIVRILFFASYACFWQFPPARSDLLRAAQIAVTLGLLTVIAVDFAVCGGCVYLFWDKSWSVRKAFGMYNPVVVLVVNFVVHFLPLVVDGLLLWTCFSKISEHFRCTRRILLAPVISLLPAAATIQFFVIYYFTMTPDTVYGTSLDIGHVVIPAFICIFLCTSAVLNTMV